MSLVLMSNNEEILVSVCIPVYNGEIFVRRALQSCLNQTYKNIEVVLVDDKSQDNTLKIAQEYAAKDKRIKIHKNESNLGAAGNFLQSFKLANGYLVQHLGIDDWLDEDHIEEKVKIFKQFPDVAFITSAVAFYKRDESGDFHLKNKMISKPGFYSADFVFKNFYLEKGRGLIGLISMGRRDDVVKNFLTNLPNKWNYDHFYEKGAQAIDIFVFLNILVQYQRMYFLDKVFYNALVHERRLTAYYLSDLKRTLAYVIKSNHADFVCYTYFFANKAPQYLTRYKILSGANVLVAVLFCILRLYRMNFKESVGNLRNFFEDYSLLEKFLVMIYTPWRIAERGILWLERNYSLKS